ncbi:putative membrane protein [Bifidobacterium commune]|uniref:hypothetical protein n=1 Tax=Bifidobacterium commune TaxID=1505727 RepID=UPI0018351853|nr:hypothetical protein [Bifidobacterium commune]MBB2955792.1 putative membrane protein [Bifidobacterium commune]
MLDRFGAAERLLNSRETNEDSLKRQERALSESSNRVAMSMQAKTAADTQAQENQPAAPEPSQPAPAPVTPARTTGTPAAKAGPPERHARCAIATGGTLGATGRRRMVRAAVGQRQHLAEPSLTLMPQTLHTPLKP